MDKKMIMWFFIGWFGAMLLPPQRIFAYFKGQ